MAKGGRTQSTNKQQKGRGGSKKPIAKGKGKTGESRKRQSTLSAEELDHQLFSYMGVTGNKLVLDDQLTEYMKTAAE